MPITYRDARESLAYKLTPHFASVITFFHDDGFGGCVFNNGFNPQRYYGRWVPKPVTRADLEATIAEQAAEIRELRMSRKMRGDDIEELRQQLAAQQAYAEQLRGCLDMWLLATVNDRTEYAGARAITRKELASDHDTTALQEYGAKLVERISTMTLSTYALKQIANQIREGTFK